MNAKTVAVTRAITTHDTNSTVLRFDAPHLTPDSAYFAEAPTALAPRGANLKHGRLRASICPAGERYCRELVLPVDL